MKTTQGIGTLVSKRSTDFFRSAPTSQMQVIQLSLRGFLF